jgi:hypothetical protein
MAFLAGYGWMGTCDNFFGYQYLMIRIRSLEIGRRW